MRWFEKIIAAHTAITDQVSHFERMQSDRYFVWQEDGNNDLSADGLHAEKAVTGFTDLFTTVEFDPWVDALGENLSSYSISWSLRDVMFEEETGITHYTWDWEALDGGKN